MGNDAPIGVFDSGIGGLTVVKEIRQMLPAEDIIYVGDTARVPYGSRDPQEIIVFMNQILRFFAQQKVKMAVIACNTMTGYGYEQAKDAYPYLLVPMDTVVGEAIAVSGNKSVGVIATEGAVQSHMHQKAAQKIDAQAVVHAKACPGFVPLIENGQIDGEQMEAAVKEYLEYFADKGIGALILGCTHYPLIAPIIRRYVDKDVQLINPAAATAKDAVRALTASDLLKESPAKGKMQMCFSADLGKARKMAELILKENTAVFKGIDLAEY